MENNAEFNTFVMTLGIIAYNEEKNLGRLFENILEQTYPHERMEVLLIDGRSEDKTKEMMLKFKQEHENEFHDVLVLDNPGRTQPCGWNVVIRNSHGDAIVRVDAHAEIAENFIERNVYHLTQGEDVCGGYRPNIIDDDTPWRRTLLAAESSLFGSSISDFRRDGEDRVIKSVFHGAYRKAVFDKVGFFNEQLVRTEDNDIHYRIREAGYKIWFHPDIRSYQHIRENLASMIRQKYKNGFWIGRTIGISPKCLAPYYYFVPFVFVLAIIFTGILAAAGHPALALLMWGTYCLMAIANALISVIHDPNRNYLYALLPVLFLILHVSYGVGTIFGLISLLTDKPGKTEA